VALYSRSTLDHLAVAAALKAARAAVEDAVASHSAVETLVNKFCNTIAQLPLATRTSDAQPATTADRAALNENLGLAQSVVEPPQNRRLYQPCLYLRFCADAICAVGWMDLMIILLLLLCLTRCEPR
jgi:hypothetical protein